MQIFDANAVPAAVAAPDAEAPPGAIHDAETALRIGLRAIEERFAPEVVERNKPYHAVLVRKEWWVMGTSDAQREAAKLQESLGPGNFVSVRGGAPTAVISSEDGRVVEVSHGR